MVEYDPQSRSALIFGFLCRYFDTVRLLSTPTNETMTFRFPRSALLPCLLLCVLIQAIHGENAPKPAAPAEEGSVVAVVPSVEDQMMNDAAPMEDSEGKR